jgi:hypothetical protein
MKLSLVATKIILYPLIKTIAVGSVAYLSLN